MIFSLLDFMWTMFFARYGLPREKEIDHDGDPKHFYARKLVLHFLRRPK